MKSSFHKGETALQSDNVSSPGKDNIRLQDFEEDDHAQVENGKRTKLTGSIFEKQVKNINQGSQEELSLNKSRKSSKATFHNVSTPGA